MLCLEAELVHRCAAAPELVVRMANLPKEVGVVINWEAGAKPRCSLNESVRIADLYEGRTRRTSEPGLFRSQQVGRRDGFP